MDFKDCHSKDWIQGNAMPSLLKIPNQDFFCAYAILAALTISINKLLVHISNQVQYDIQLKTAYFHFHILF